MSNRLHLFQAYGIELEYMIVDKKSLAVRPLTDLLFKKVTGEYTGDVDRGMVSWCNELVLHVVELKCTKPEAHMSELADQFHKNVEELNELLDSFGAMLLPTAAHPLMNPEKSTFLWPHDNNDIYAAYNRIFNCHGHGWSNLQSTHLNLPFYDDEEFARLHAAVRLILPILPALAASSPILGGKETGFLDKRLDYYQKNQKVIPSITGKVIPERAFSKRQYHKMIYDRIAHDIAPHDPENILQPVWLNSRGAIARFDRGSIEIRLLDIQECPQADLAIVNLIVLLLKLLVEEKICSHHEQQQWEAQPLNDIFQATIRRAENATIENADYLKMFGVEGKSITAKKLWAHLIKVAQNYYPEEVEAWMPQLKVIMEQGTLATRILNSVSGEYSEGNINLIYRELSDCLKYNEMFQVWVKEQL